MRVRTVIVLIAILIAILSCPVALPAQEAVVPPVMTLEEAVRTALAQNPGIRASAEQAEAAAARVRAARSDRLLNVGVNVEYRRIASPPTFEIPALGPDLPPRTVTAGSRENLVATLTARQAVFTSGRIPAQITRAEALLDAALGRFGALQEDIALRTMEAYNILLLNQALVTSAEQNLATAREQLDIATVRFEVGTAPRFDVLRAQTQVSEAEQSLTEAENAVQIAVVALNRVMGIPQESRYALVQPEAAPVITQDTDAFVEIALREREELLAARSQVAAAEAGIRLAESARGPEVGVSANYTTATDDSAVQATGWSFVAAASIEIFDGGRIRANIDEARSLTAEAQANLEDTTEAVEQSVRQAYLNLLTSWRTINTARTRLDQAQEAYDVAVVRYQAGVGTAVEVADALATLTAARTNVDRAIYNYNIDYARLQRSIGRASDIALPDQSLTPKRDTRSAQSTTPDSGDTSQSSSMSAMDGSTRVGR